jgi:hypothetical protein
MWTPLHRSLFCCHRTARVGLCMELFSPSNFRSNQAAIINSARSGARAPCSNRLISIIPASQMKSNVSVKDSDDFVWRHPSSITELAPRPANSPVQNSDHHLALSYHSSLAKRFFRSLMEQSRSSAQLWLIRQCAPQDRNLPNFEICLENILDRGGIDAYRVSSLGLWNGYI